MDRAYIVYSSPFAGSVAQLPVLGLGPARVKGRYYESNHAETFCWLQILVFFCLCKEHYTYFHISYHLDSAKATLLVFFFLFFINKLETNGEQSTFCIKLLLQILISNYNFLNLQCI